MSASRKKINKIDEYIKTFPEDVQIILEKIRHTVRKVAPDAVETISYQMPAFKQNGRNLIYFAAWKEHIGLYPTPSGTKAFKKELAQYKVTKGSVQFPLNKPIPYALIGKIVKYKTKENVNGR